MQPSLDPPAATLAPCAAHIAASNAALDRLEMELEEHTDAGTASALEAVNDAATELRAAFAFVDQLEESISAAGLLVEATERRLEVLERGERLPDSLAQLPPALFTNHQFTRQVRRREKPATPDLPELTLLPPSRAEASRQHDGASVAGVAGASLPAAMSADELQRLAASKAAELQSKADELQRFAASRLASAREQAPQLLAAAERARSRAKSLFGTSSGTWSSGLWGGGGT